MVDPKENISRIINTIASLWFQMWDRVFRHKTSSVPKISKVSLCLASGKNVRVQMLFVNSFWRKKCIDQ